MYEYLILIWISACIVVQQSEKMYIWFVEAILL